MFQWFVWFHIIIIALYIYIYYPFIRKRATLNPKSVLVCITSPTLSPPSVLWTSNTTFPGRADSGLTFRDISLQVQIWCDITCIELYRESTGSKTGRQKLIPLPLTIFHCFSVSSHGIYSLVQPKQVKSQNTVLSLYKINMPLSAPPCGWTLLGGLETSTKATAVNIKTGTTTTTTTTYYNDDGNRHDQPTTTKYQIPPPSALSCTSFLSFLHSPPIKLSHTGWHLQTHDFFHFITSQGSWSPWNFSILSCGPARAWLDVCRSLANVLWCLKDIWDMNGNDNAHIAHRSMHGAQAQACQTSYQKKK